jgi:hypothetical protein
MGNWQRMAAMNRIGGTSMTRLELDVLPGLRCGAHFTVVVKTPPNDAERRDFLLRSGQALQRFWLTATQHGLALQPSFAPLWFGHFSRHRIAFTEDRKLLAKSAIIAERLDAESQGRGEQILFRGRLGHPVTKRIIARSVRRNADELVGAQRSLF